MESFVLWILQSIALCLLGWQRESSFFKARGSAFRKQDPRSGLNLRLLLALTWTGRVMVPQERLHLVGLTVPVTPSLWRASPPVLHAFLPLLFHADLRLPTWLCSSLTSLPLTSPPQAGSQRPRPRPATSSLPRPVTTVTCTTQCAHLGCRNGTPKRQGLFSTFAGYANPGTPDTWGWIIFGLEGNVLFSSIKNVFRC